MNWFWLVAGMTIAALSCWAEVWRKRSIFEMKAEEHIRACTDPDYFLTKEQRLQKEVARLQEENTQLARELGKQGPFR